MFEIEEYVSNVPCTFPPGAAVQIFKPSTGSRSECMLLLILLLYYFWVRKLGLGVPDEAANREAKGGEVIEGSVRRRV